MWLITWCLWPAYRGLKHRSIRGTEPWRRVYDPLIGDWNPINPHTISYHHLVYDPLIGDWNAEFPAGVPGRLKGLWPAYRGLKLPPPRWLGRYSWVYDPLIGDWNKENVGSIINLLNRLWPAYRGLKLCNDWQYFITMTCLWPAYRGLKQGEPAGIDPDEGVYDPLIGDWNHDTWASIQNIQEVYDPLIGDWNPTRLKLYSHG